MSQPTGNAFLNSISQGGWYWGTPDGSKLVLTYFFDEDYYEWFDAEKQAYRDAFETWASVADFTVREVFTEAAANFVAHTVDADDAFNLGFGVDTLGWHEGGEDSQDGVVEGFFVWDNYLSFDALGVGGYDYYTYLHEIGHGLNLAHPHDRSTNSTSVIMPGVSSAFGDYGTGNQNQGAFTVMSYNVGHDQFQGAEDAGLETYGFNSGLGALDIAIIQVKQGANTSYRNGNDTYRLSDKGSWTCIWDTGGTDTLAYAGSGDAILDLRPATITAKSGATANISMILDGGGKKYYGGYTIADDYTNALANRGGVTGVIIENATGGRGNDTIGGNDVANRLKGNAGNDFIGAFDGNDFLFGDGGNDNLYGNAGKDRLDGGKGKDKLFGGDQNDQLDGGKGNDKLHGGSGKDKFKYKNKYGKDLIKDFQNNKDTLQLDDKLWSGRKPIKKVLDLFGSAKNGDFMLDFGGGDVLTIKNIKQAQLADDIQII